MDLRLNLVLRSQPGDLLGTEQKWWVWMEQGSGFAAAITEGVRRSSTEWPDGLQSWGTAGALLWGESTKQCQPSLAVVPYPHTSAFPTLPVLGLIKVHLSLGISVFYCLFQVWEFPTISEFRLAPFIFVMILAEKNFLQNIRSPYVITHKYIIISGEDQ